MIPELRKKTEDDELYVRPPEIQAALEELYSIPIEEVVARAKYATDGQADYVPTECVLHFVRRSLENGDTAPYQALFEVLRLRLMKLVPVRYRRTGSDQYTPVSSYAADLQERVMDKFLQMLCEDRKEYDERLDIYEARFNMAFASLRSTAKKALTKHRKREEPVEFDNESSPLGAELEERLASVRKNTNPEENLFRLELLRAIDQLPDEQRRIIQLIHVENMPIDSKDPEQTSIAKVLDCSERTVRNRRDRAYEGLRVALGEEEGEI